MCLSPIILDKDSYSHEDYITDLELNVAIRNSFFEKLFLRALGMMHILFHIMIETTAFKEDNKEEDQQEDERNVNL